MQAGLYLAHKPVGQTSFSLVLAMIEEIRLSGLRPDKLPVCHGGALDPFAEGLMLLLAGQTTRLMELLHPIPKTYVAQVRWGAETDNGDLLGRVVAEGDPAALTPAQLDLALPAFLGFQEQVPPNTSNKRVDGERAYAKAHRGEEFVLPPSRVYLHAARFTAHALPRESTLELTCRGGYYVRSLARDLGRALGCRAHLGALRRTAIGPWSDPGPGVRVHLRGPQLLPWCPSRAVSPAEEKALRAFKPIGRGAINPPDWPLPAGFPDPQAPVRALTPAGLIALLREDGLLLAAAPLLKGPI